MLGIRNVSELPYVSILKQDGSVDCLSRILLGMELLDRLPNIVLL